MTTPDESYQDAPEPVKTPPPSFNYMGTVYVPPQKEYYRNKGNKEILSRGDPC